MDIQKMHTEAVALLKHLIAIPSVSRQENKTADYLFTYLKNNGIDAQRTGNNVWARSRNFDAARPTILLNSHHDTVPGSDHWTTNPLTPTVEGNKLTGLGSNDAGASLVCLLTVFVALHNSADLPYNLIFAASAEEEVSGRDGIELLLPELGKIDFGIVGEPTAMQMATAEKGLLVLDCVARGRAGHAARNEGVNAIYIALSDIEWLRTYRFPNQSEALGDVKISVTQIEAGQKHNVVPDTCRFVVDIRTTDQYSNREVYEYISSQIKSECTARSFRLNSSASDMQHPIVQRGMAMGLTCYGSPTMSDQALMAFPTLKIGPGESARSHTANEYILLSEIQQGLEIYYQLIAGSTRAFV